MLLNLCIGKVFLKLIFSFEFWKNLLLHVIGSKLIGIHDPMWVVSVERCREAYHIFFFIIIFCIATWQWSDNLYEPISLVMTLLYGFPICQSEIEFNLVSKLFFRERCKWFRSMMFNRLYMSFTHLYRFAISWCVFDAIHFYYKTKAFVAVIPYMICHTW